MEYTSEQIQEFEDFQEQEVAKIFGDAKARQRKNRRYVSKLVKQHGEELIRAILMALSKVDDFIPAEELRESAVRPLIGCIRRYDIPWFYFEKIEANDETVRVAVSHGIPEAARGETVVFVRTASGLELVDSYRRWIS